MSASEVTKSVSQREVLRGLGDSLGGNLHELYLSETLSDVTILAQGTRLPAHRIVLYSQSTFFKSALSVDMKEKLEGVIELPESLEVVKAMLSFLYKRCYPDPTTRSLEFHAQVYIAAEKYNIVPLKQYAAYGRIRRWLIGFEKTIRSAGSSALSLALQEDMLEFLEVVVLVYSHTLGYSDIARCELAITARKLLRTYSADLDEAWTKCSSEAPAIFLDFVKSEDPNNEDWLAFHSWQWRTAEDVVIRECNECDSAVITAVDSCTDTKDHRHIGKDSLCPLHELCGGKLEQEYPNY